MPRRRWIMRWERCERSTGISGTFFCFALEKIPEYFLIDQKKKLQFFIEKISWFFFLNRITMVPCVRVAHGTRRDRLPYRRTVTIFTAATGRPAGAAAGSVRGVGGVCPIREIIPRRCIFLRRKPGFLVAVFRWGVCPPGNRHPRQSPITQVSGFSGSPGSGPP